MNLSAAALEARRCGRPKTDRSEKVASRRPGARCGLQRADVNPELGGELTQRQELCPPWILGGQGSGTVKGVQGELVDDHCPTFGMSRERRRATPRTPTATDPRSDGAHECRPSDLSSTVPSLPRVVKRSSACVADDHAILLNYSVR